MHRTKRNLLILLASAVILFVLVWVLRPYDLLNGSRLGPKTTAHILSVKRVPALDHRRTGAHMAKLSIQLDDGQTATAAALVKQITDCSIGDSVAVRLLATTNAEEQSYRMVSKSCTKADW